MRHGVPEIEMNDDLNFSADKQISRQISTIVFANALFTIGLGRVRLFSSLLFTTIFENQGE